MRARACEESTPSRGTGALSGDVQAVVSKGEMRRMLIIMALLLGWQFTLGEFVGGPLMIVLMALLFRAFLERRLVDDALEQAERGVIGKMEGHAEMDMSVHERRSLWRRLTPPRGFTATANDFVMDWAAIWIDIIGGLLIAGALAAWVPEPWWQSLFLDDHETLAKFWGPIIGPLVAIISFVCSIGNVPLAAVLWNGGISFGGVLAFIFADLIVLPILDIYRKYYGWKMAGFLLATFYAARVGAGPIVEFLFGGLGLIPRRGLRHLELHDRAQHPLPRPGSAARLALLPPRRRPRHAEDDEQADDPRARARACIAPSSLQGVLLGSETTVSRGISSCSCSPRPGRAKEALSQSQYELTASRATTAVAAGTSRTRPCQRLARVARLECGYNTRRRQGA